MAGRRAALYFSWDRTAEQNCPLSGLDNRYPALFELRRALWPVAAGLSGLANQGIDGFLETIVLGDFDQFRALGEKLSGNPVELYQRTTVDGRHHPVAEWLDGVDTLVLISLDHLVTDQAPGEREIAAVKAFLARGGVLFVCLHHDVGTTSDPAAELAHHGDRLVPSVQRIGGFGRALLAALGLEVENRYGLQPARAADGRPAPLLKSTEGLAHAILDGVDTFNVHPHLPDLQIASTSLAKLHVVARQELSLQAPPHPGVPLAERYFNAMLLTRPEANLGTVFICDATLWSSAFGGDDSLRRLWSNLFLLPQTEQ